MRLDALILSLAFCGPLSSLPAAPPTRPLPAPSVGTVESDSTPATLAKIDGKWIFAETSTANAVIRVDSKAKWVQVRAARIVSVTLDTGQKLEVVAPGDVPVVEIHGQDTKCFGVQAGPGVYQVRVTQFDPSAAPIETLERIVIGPGPDPEPEPDPEPPEPVAELPFVSDGPAVLMIVEKSELGKLPAAQRAIFSSAQVHQFIRSKAVKLDDGDYFYRVWDDDYERDDLDQVPRELSDAYEKVLEESEQLPWIAVTNGKDKGFKGPLPESVEALMVLLKETL